MKQKAKITALSCTFLFACHEQIIKSAVNSFKECAVLINQDSSITVQINSDLKIKAKLVEEFNGFKTYSYLEMFSDTNKIFEDTAYEYELDQNSVPKQRTLKNNTTELLLVWNDRPSSNKYLRFLINKNKLLSIDTLPILSPSFPSKEKVSGNEEFYSGYMDAAEAVCMNCDSVIYNPKLYFRITDQGLKLDSSKTEMENEKYFGKFYGYSASYEIKIRVPKNKK